MKQDKLTKGDSVDTGKKPAAPKKKAPGKFVPFKKGKGMIASSDGVMKK